MNPISFISANFVARELEYIVFTRSATRVNGVQPRIAWGAEARKKFVEFF
jgi:hypothetical protein